MLPGFFMRNLWKVLGPPLIVAVALSPNVWHALIHRCLQAVDDPVECVLAFARTARLCSSSQKLRAAYRPRYRSSALCNNPASTMVWCCGASPAPLETNPPRWFLKPGPRVQSCPLYPREADMCGATRMPALGHKRTSIIFPVACRVKQEPRVPPAGPRRDAG
jgi:hypothetical protein